MSKKSSLSRRLRRRTAAALATAGALVMSSGLVMLSATTATANGQGNDPGGNNGTVKVGTGVDIDDNDSPQPNNHPHLPCTFNIQWYNFDSEHGQLNATVEFELKAPTDDKNGNAFLSIQGDTTPSFTGNGGQPGAGDGLDHTEWYTLLISGPPHPQQGFHVKITVTTPHSKGGDKKFKTFWVEPCGATPQNPTVQQSPKCEVEGSYTIPSTEGVQYLLNGNPIAAGTYSGPASGTITAQAKPGYQLTDPNWSFALNVPAAQDCEDNITGTPTVTFDDPDCDDPKASYSAFVGGVADGPNDHVTFTVTSGSVAPGSSVTVTATADQGWKFPDGQSSKQFTHKFKDVPSEEECEERDEVTPSVTFVDPTCEDLDGADWTGGETDKVDYALTSGEVEPGGSVVVTATAKDGYVFPAGTDATFEHTYPTIESLDCPTVAPSESVKPKPTKKPGPPTVAGTQAGVPTAVSAGLAGTPAEGSSTQSLLAQMMVAGGLLLLLAGGWTGLGRRESGAHQV